MHGVLRAEAGPPLTIPDAVAGTVRLAVSDRSRIPGLDAQSQAAFERRLADVDDDIDETIEHRDVARFELARRDREYLVAELVRWPRRLLRPSQD